MALQGTLEDFGIADMFQLIGQQQKTGVLVVTHKNRVVHVTFREGHILAAEAQNRDRSERLGEMMVLSGLISQDQLQSALDLQKKTLQKLGAVLLEQQHIKKAELDEFIYLQTKETIYKLFRWNTGTYEFHQQEVTATAEFFQPISAEHILMDGFRMMDEWPSIRKKIGSLTLIYERVPEKPLPRDSSSQPAATANLDAGVFEEKKKSASLQTEGFSPHVERVYEWIDGQRDVQTLIALCRLGEFETCHSLLTLLDQGYVRQASHSPAPTKADLKRKIDLYQDYEVAKVNLREVLAVLSSYAVFAVLFLFLLAPLGWGPFRGFFLTGRERIQEAVLPLLLSDYQLDRVKTALEIYYVQKNHYPDSLKVLVEAGLLKKKDLHYPWKHPYLYWSDGSKYRLERPVS